MAHKLMQSSEWFLPLEEQRLAVLVAASKVLLTPAFLGLLEVAVAGGA
jgi:hypothetical protein